MSRVDELLNRVRAPDVDERIEFAVELLGGRTGTCRLLIWVRETVVVSVDEGSEQGISITNGSEGIAEHVEKCHEADPESWDWFEMYETGREADRVIYRKRLGGLTVDWRPCAIGGIVETVNDRTGKLDL